MTLSEEQWAVIESDIGEKELENAAVEFVKQKVEDVICGKRNLQKWREEMAIEYVYTHATVDKGVFYVGRGRGDRYKNFWNRSDRHKAITTAAGRKNIIIEKVECEVGKAEEMEKVMIHKYILEGNELANIVLTAQKRT